jgi:hypothetical protein
MVDAPLVPQFDEVIERYLETVLRSIPEDTPYIERRLISDEKWQKYAGDTSFRYSGFLREYEPDLPKLLENRRLVIVGEPGAGKSTVTRTVTRRFAIAHARTDVPVFLSLRGYAGNLTASLAASAPNDVLSSRLISRRYVFDGLDEVPHELLSQATAQINNLLATDVGCGVIITARQAFYAAHSRELGMNLAAFHLLDFDEEDLREYSNLRGLDPQTYIDAIRDARLYEEVRNPLNAAITAERLLAGTQLSQIRSENVAWVVERVLASRPVLTPIRQRRAVQLLGVGMETYSRNELLREEAIRILCIGLDLSVDRAGEVLDELHHSILIRTASGVAFQLRSYGELLAAEALQDQSFDRVRQLAFFDDGTPNPSWMNSISFLAEQHAAVRKFFIANHPEWMLEASPAAFNERERTTISDTVITRLDNHGQFILYHPIIKARRLFRFVTSGTAERLLRDLDSSRAEVKANAMVILGMAERSEVLDAALPIALDTGRSDVLRYSAIVAIMNGGSSEHVDRILAVLDRADPYYEQLIECAAMLVAPEEIEKVLPHILATNTMLSAAFSRFSELRGRSAVVSVLEYLAAHPDVLDSIRAEGYLNPVIHAIPDHWDENVANVVTRVFVALETAHVFGEGRLKRELVGAVIRSDGQNQVCSALIDHLLSSHITPVVINRQIAEWMTVAHADQLIERRATDLIRRLSVYLPPGPVRERLAPHSGGIVSAQDENAERYRAEHALLEEERAERIATKQELVRTGGFEQALHAFHGLEEETWPELTTERREWLGEQVPGWFVETDLHRAIVHHGDNSWTQPTFLETVLKIIDRYDLRIEGDDQLVLSLRAWGFPAVANYFRRHGLSPAAQRELKGLVTDRAQDRNVLSHALSFVENSQCSWPHETVDLMTVVGDNRVEAHNQVRGAQILIAHGIGDAELRSLLGSSNGGVREVAFEALVDRQDRGTISREVTRLRHDLAALRSAEVPPPNESPAAWITKIRRNWAWDDLRELRRLTLEHRLPYLCEIVTRTLYGINPAETPTLVRTQLRFAPEEWRLRQTTLVAEYERARQFDAARNTPFERVLDKLKISTSLIAVKIWVEGKTDLPVYDKLLREAGQIALADNLDVVGGWPMLSSRPPDRWLDGCREAVIIMDGDSGRRLNKRGKPYTTTAKNAFAAVRGLPITLHVLERYGIENYFTRDALEEATGRDLSVFMPIPENIAIEDHLVDNKTRLHRLAASVAPWLINTLRSDRPSFYRKELNKEVAKHLTNGDVERTDLGGILRDVAAQYSRVRTA